jgi:opacity protein-like surface antigen
MAQEVPAGESSSGQAPVSEKRKTEGYVSLSILGTIPKNESLNVGGASFANTDVKGSAGAGLKAGIFPSFGGGFLGFEGDLFGFGGKVQSTQATGSLTSINAMVNLIARYPGEIIQPYIGVGGGLSAGMLRDVNIQGGPFALSGSSGSAAFGYQFLAGVRALVTKRVFLFGEYKYFSANYDWESEGAGPHVELDYRAQIISGGIGLSF